MNAAIEQARHPRSSAHLGAVVLCISVLGVMLSACGMVSDDTASNLFTAPGKYQFHNCQLLAQALAGTRARINELQKLSARASQEPAGQMIGGAAYRTEYLQARGDEKQILVTLKQKNCQGESTWASERSVY